MGLGSFNERDFYERGVLMQVTQQIVDMYPALQKYREYKDLEQDKSVVTRSEKWDVALYWLCAPEFRSEVEALWKAQNAPPKPEPVKPRVEAQRRLPPHHDEPGRTVTCESGRTVTLFHDGMILEDGRWLSKNDPITYTLAHQDAVLHVIADEIKQVFVRKKEFEEYKAENAILRKRIADIEARQADLERRISVGEKTDSAHRQHLQNLERKFGNEIKTRETQ